jgi:hypothetical protein
MRQPHRRHGVLVPKDAFGQKMGRGAGVELPIAPDHQQGDALGKRAPLGLVAVLDITGTPVVGAEVAAVRSCAAFYFVLGSRQIVRCCFATAMKSGHLPSPLPVKPPSGAQITLHCASKRVLSASPQHWGST